MAQPKAPSAKKAAQQENPEEQFASLCAICRELVALEKKLREEGFKIDEEVKEEEAWTRVAAAKGAVFKTKWRCVMKPRMVIRSSASVESTPARGLNFGEEIEAIGEPVDGWLSLEDGTFALIRHEKLGLLLERVGPQDPLAMKIEERKAARRARVDALLEQQKKALRKCGIASVDNAVDQVARRVKAAEQRLRQVRGADAVRAAIEHCAVPQELLPDGTEMFTCDLLSSGRGACQRCYSCGYYRWTSRMKQRDQSNWYLKDPNSMRCDECGCMNTEHKEIGKHMGEPGFHPGMTYDEWADFGQTH